MTEYQTDEEQIEQIKRWWSDNAKSIITGIVLGVGGLVGWNYYQSFTHTRAVASSEVYYTLESSIQNKNSAQIESALATLGEKYAATPYLGLGKLATAKMYVESGELDKAAANLRWVMENAKEQDSITLAKLRLAEVLNAQGDYDQALAMLDSGIPVAYTSLLEEYRGDAYVGKNQLKEARSAYDRAIIATPGKADFLQWKRDALDESAGVPVS